ncbi:hypothetical protein [Aquitalea sp. LB_tupeE]|uniref:hypothetical protein n=1 Tax=Aquitalea sp. LB_tupeE TaxID=2748078 RepID=UPI0015BB6BE2|nr:hypothetical protein [Aquitalea sp. LB_tupeE]NWK80372.1 hypothetical protein [Aquitalea sp. LB_tupeE]
MMNHRHICTAIGIFSLISFNAYAANQPEDTAVELGWNTLNVHVNQTLASTIPGQYSIKNLFSADPARAWVFHAEEQYPKAEIIKNPAILTLTLTKPSSLFAIVLSPGYSKSTATQFQNASPKSVIVSLYRQNDTKPFESRRFTLSYHAREYSLPQLKKELKNVAFTDQTDDRITGKSENLLNSAERMLLINPDNAQIAKVELKITTMEHGAKYTDLAISKLKLFDRQAHQNSAEYRLNHFIMNEMNNAAKKLNDSPRCISYTDRNPWPKLNNYACSGPAAQLLQGQADQGTADVILTRKDIATQQYQVPFFIALSDAQSSIAAGKKYLRVSAGDIANSELILSKDSANQLQALSGLTLTQAFQANRSDGLNKAYLQPQNESYYFFSYSRLQFTPSNSGYKVNIYGPTGSQEESWLSK